MTVPIVPTAPGFIETEAMACHRFDLIASSSW